MNLANFAKSSVVKFSPQKLIPCKHDSVLKRTNNIFSPTSKSCTKPTKQVAVLRHVCVQCATEQATEDL